MDDNKQYDTQNYDDKKIEDEINKKDFLENHIGQYLDDNGVWRLAPKPTEAIEKEEYIKNLLK